MEPAETRYPMKLSPTFRPLLALFGGTRSRSFVEITDTGLRAKFGWLSDYRFPLEDVARVEQRSWPLLFGVGWRIGLNGRIGLIGNFGNVVEIHFHKRQRVTMLIPRLRCDSLAVSLEDPEGLISAVERRIGK